MIGMVKFEFAELAFNLHFPGRSHAQVKIVFSSHAECLDGG